MSEWAEFDAAKGEQAKADGMAQAMGADRVALWKADADAWLVSLRSGETFTLDRVVAACGVPDIGANRVNVVGAWTSGHARKGDIVFTGRMIKSARVTRHAGMQRVWRKA